MVENKIFSKVFMWMFVGLLVTFGVGAIVAANENMVYNVFNNLYIFLVIAQIGVVVWLSARIHKMQETTAKILFILYSGLTGLTFSSIFVCFNLQSILLVFAVTALLFALFACLGYFTNIDLTKIGTFLFMTLLGLLIVSLVNLFLGNTMLDMICCWIGILIFIAYIAYDMQKIKLLANQITNENKLAIIGALELYLDFINLFIRLLQLFGKSND